MNVRENVCILVLNLHYDVNAYICEMNDSIQLFLYLFKCMCEINIILLRNDGTKVHSKVA